MSTVFLSKILFVHKLLNSFLLYLLPKKLRTYLSSSSYCQEHQKQSFNPHKQTKPTSPRSSSSSRRMDSSDLKRVFQMFDRNGDGRITKRELGDSLENMGIFIPDKELAQMIEKIDVDGDGCVDIDEFKDLYKTIMDERDEEEDMREAFNVFDQNGDGFITVDELKSVLSSLGLKRGRTVEDCKKMITRVDADGDGMVNFVEFKQMMMGAGLASLA